MQSLNVMVAILPLPSSITMEPLSGCPLGQLNVIGVAVEMMILPLSGSLTTQLTLKPLLALPLILMSDTSYVRPSIPSASDSYVQLTLEPVMVHVAFKSTVSVTPPKVMVKLMYSIVNFVVSPDVDDVNLAVPLIVRSEERRVGKECRL